MATVNPAINAAIQQIIAAQKAPIVNAQNRYDAQAQQQQENITGLTQALAGILGGIAPGIQKTYGDAAQSQAGFAKGFSDELQARLGQNADTTSSFLQNVVGAPSSQVDQVRGQVAPTAAGDTLYGLRGYIPASTLNEEGAAYTASAKQLPGIASTQGLQQIAKVQAAQRDQDAAFGDKIAEVAGTIPKLRSDLGKQAFDEAYKTHSANLQDAKFSLQQSVDAFNAKYKIKSYNLSVKSLNFQAQKFARTTLNSDRSYAVALANLGLKQASAKRAALAQEYKLANGGFTPTQLNKFDTDAQFVASQALSAKTKPTVTEAMQQMYQRHVPLSKAVAALRSVYGDVFGQLQLDLVGVGQKANPFPASGVVTAAQSFLGVPYKWGGNNPKTGLDCSSFIQQTFAKVGIKLPRTTYAQVKYGTAVPDVALLQPGDVIFTRLGKAGPQHVGLYIGDGQVQESPHTGDVNKVIPLQSYLSDGLVAIRRYGGA